MLKSASQWSRQHLLNQLAMSRSGLLIINYECALPPARRGGQAPEPVPQIGEALARIHTQTQTRLVIVSDRRAQQVRKLLGVHPTPEIWGCHGLQRLRENGSQEFFPIADRAQDALNRAASLLEEEGLQDTTELQHGSLRVRWNSFQPEAIEQVMIRSRRVLEAVASGGAVILSRTAEGMELRAPRAGKGSAVLRILQEAQPEDCVAYIGCDISDEEAFRAVKNRGFRILVRCDGRERSADVRLDSPEELATFLSEWFHAVRGAVQVSTSSTDVSRDVVS